MLIDSHCHLDFEALAADIDGVLARADTAGVSGMVTISTHVEKFSTYAGLAERYANVWCSVGTHPHHADEELHIQTEDLVRLSAHPRCVAIGEAGLDYFYDNAPREAQATGLRRHIAASRITGLPLVIHSRQADDDMAKILEEEARQGAFPFVLHCFTAGAELAERALALGGYISFSGIITFRNAEEIREVAKAVPADRYLVETDAPYLAPTPHRGQSNEPSFVRHTAGKVAEVRGITLEQVGAETTANFARLFSKTGLA
ncbi:TatD family hydrolase [Devosia sp. RR2S18]|uniref:TatD family hydrolase n=1 Tax=Devosia rhizosphaerae TaxID=3049774 RepID=UPI002541ACEC|nr:TatD family hydrolase [Devosia sp. RR2S18]WIJ23605.1 TatD family hydrolase [Devosia sp. RR2S18]